MKVKWSKHLDGMRARDEREEEAERSPTSEEPVMKNSNSSSSSDSSSKKNGGGIMHFFKFRDKKRRGSDASSSISVDNEFELKMCGDTSKATQPAANIKRSDSVSGIRSRLAWQFSSSRFSGHRNHHKATKQANGNAAANGNSVAPFCRRNSVPEPPSIPTAESGATPKLRAPLPNGKSAGRKEKQINSHSPEVASVTHDSIGKSKVDFNNASSALPPVPESPHNNGFIPGSPPSEVRVTNGDRVSDINGHMPVSGAPVSWESSPTNICLEPRRLVEVSTYVGAALGKKVQQNRAVEVGLDANEVYWHPHHPKTLANGHGNSAGVVQLGSQKFMHPEVQNFETLTTGGSSVVSLVSNASSALAFEGNLRNRSSARITPISDLRESDDDVTLKYKENCHPTQSDPNLLDDVQKRADKAVNGHFISKGSLTYNGYVNGNCHPTKSDPNLLLSSSTDMRNSAFDKKSPTALDSSNSVDSGYHGNGAKIDSDPNLLAETKLPNILKTNKAEQHAESTSFKPKSLSSLSDIRRLPAISSRNDIPNRPISQNSKPRSLALGKLHLDSDGKKPSLTSPSKAELNRLNQEIQHLGALCENRTKELNLLKMQLKHTTLGFDAFASLIRYLTEELDSFSHPHMVEELQKTREELKETEHKLKFCEEELEKIKEYHATEISELNEKLTLVKEEEITQLQAKHVSDLEELKTLHEQELAQAADSHETSLKKTQEKHTLEIEELNKEFKRMQEEIVDTHNKQLEAANLYHEETKTTLTSQISNLRKQYEELQKQTKQFEEALQKDTNEKIQWISAKKADLEKEVDSLKAVLEMKRNEIHSLRAENAELKKELEELPLAREKIKMLKARAEDLQALVNQKVRVQRQLSSEHQHLKESFEKESRTNMRLSMEKEELEWKLKQNMEASLLLTSIAGPEILQKFAKEHPTSAPSSLMLSSADLSSLVADTSLNFGDSFEKTSPTVGQQLPKKSPLRSPVSISASTPCSPQLKNTRRKRTTSKSEMNTPAVEPSFNKSEPYSISQDILQSIIANAVEMATNHKQSHKSTKKSPKESTPCSTKEKPELNKKCDKRLEKLDLFLNLEEDTGACHVDDIDIIDDIDLQVENECYDADIAVLEDSLVSDRISSGSRKSHSPLSEGGSCPLEVGGKVKTPLSDNISMNVSRGNASVCESLLDRCLEGVEGGSEEKGLVMEPVFIDVRSGETPKKSERCEFVEPPKVYQVTTPESVKELVVSSKSPVSDGGQTKVILSATQPSCTATHLPTTEDSSSSMQSSMTSSSDSSSWSAALPTSPHHISCEASNASLSSEDPSICSSNGSSRNAVARRDDDQFFATFEECATGGSTPDDGSQHRLHFENITVCHYRVASPRSLAGEAMVQDSTSPSFSQFTSEESSGYRCGGSDHVRPEVDDEFCEQQGSQQLGIPEAPSTLPTFDPPSLEASSQGIILTDSTNIDGSWCEEELPSESEA